VTGGGEAKRVRGERRRRVRARDGRRSEGIAEALPLRVAR